MKISNVRFDKLIKMHLSMRESRKHFASLSQDEIRDLGLDATNTEVYLQLVVWMLKWLAFFQLLMLVSTSVQYFRGTLAIDLVRALLLIAAFSLLAIVLPFVLFGVAAAFWHGSILVERFRGSSSKS